MLAQAARRLAFHPAQRPLHLLGKPGDPKKWPR